MHYKTLLIISVMVLFGLLYLRTRGLSGRNISVAPTPIASLNPEITNSSATDFFGRSTQNPCQGDDDCKAGGCSSEICQGKLESLTSICILPDKPTPQNLGYRCSCVINKCQWQK